METVFTKRHFMTMASIVSLFIVGPTIGAAQAVDGATVLRKVDQTLSGFDDFIATFEAEVNMERLRVPKMEGTIYFKKPDKLHVESKNFTMVPREGVFLNPTLLLERYDVSIVGIDTLDNEPHYKLQLAARNGQIRLRQMFLWVNQLRWTITQMETVPSAGRSFTMKYSYGIERGVHLPIRIVAEIDSNDREPSDPFMEANPDFTPRADRMKRAIQNGTITIMLSNYQLNVGLADDRFRPAKE
jgi:outer membrane lipoprotein-sorting protein